jgi:hypothetical protein
MPRGDDDRCRSTVAGRRSGQASASEQRRWRHGVAIPPVRLRLDLRVEVEQVRAKLLGIRREVRTVRARLAFWHRGLLSDVLID